MAKPPDRRQWVTPEDLNVSPEVLGLPLASPTRRLVAMALDLVTIGLLSSLANAWLLGALALVGIEHARGQQRGRSLRRQRWVGGAAALLVVAGVAQLWQDSRQPKKAHADRVAQALAEAAQYEAEASAEAQEAAKEVAHDAAHDATEPASEVATAAASAATPAVSGDPDTAVAPASAASADLREGPPSAAVSRALVQQSQRIQKLEHKLEEARALQSLDPRAWIRRWANELGLGYGMAMVYFSLLPAWWGGQTVGKRLLGLRVVELTGKPMGALLCLKRFGGYAAGMATGGLGLAQLLWDPNRQAIQDKTAHSAVIDLRRPRLSALAGPPAEPPPISSRSASPAPP